MARRCFVFVSVLFFGTSALEADLLPSVPYQATPLPSVSPFTYLEEAFGISNTGVVVGDFFASYNAGLPSPLVEGGFTYDTKTGVASPFAFPAPDNYTFRAVGINDDGEIIARTYTYLGGPNYDRYQGLIGGPGAFKPLTFPGSISTQPSAINDSGVVVGTYLDASNARHGFIYKPNGDFQTVDAPGGGTFLRGINNLGQIVGSNNDGAFLLSNDLYTTLACGQPSFGVPTGINDFGTISGDDGVLFDSRNGSCVFVGRQNVGINNSDALVAGDRNIYTPTPEPQSLLLVLGAGLALALFGRVIRRTG